MWRRRCDDDEAGQLSRKEASKHDSSMRQTGEGRGRGRSGRNGIADPRLPHISVFTSAGKEGKRDTAPHLGTLPYLTLGTCPRKSSNYSLAPASL